MAAKRSSTAVHLPLHQLRCRYAIAEARAANDRSVTMRFPVMTISRLQGWLIVSVVSALLYLPAVGFDFAYDDYHQILYRESITGNKPLASVITAPTFPGDLYRPLTTATYWLQYRISGDDARSFHLLNILLHIFCSLGIFELAARLLSHRGAALFAAALFAVHPIHVEAVANVVGRAELLACGFSIAACLAFASFIEANKRAGLLLFLSAALFAAAIFSKESALTMLPLIPLFAWMAAGARTTQRTRRSAAGSAALLISAALYLEARLLVLGENFLVSADLRYFHPENPLFGYGFTDRVIPGLKLFGDYLRQMLLPASLKIDYSLGYWDFWNSVYSVSGAVSLAAAGLLFALAIDAADRNVKFFAAWTAVTFALTCNVIVVIGTVMADRLAYLPSAGFLCLPAALLVRKNRFLSPPTLKVAAVVVLAAFYALAAMRLPVWQNNGTVFSQAVRDNPRSPKSAVALAEHWYYREKDVEKAEYWFRRTLELDPANIYAARHMIDISVRNRRYGSAEYFCRQVLKFEPEDKIVREKLNILVNLRKQEPAHPERAARESQAGG